MQMFPPHVASTSPGVPNSDAVTVTETPVPPCGGTVIWPTVPWNSPAGGMISSTPPSDVSMVVENCPSSGAVGVNGAEAADGSESPLALCAVTVHEYSTSFVSPVTCAVVAPSVDAECESSGFPVAVHVTV